jgi:hypothetical protein
MALEDLKLNDETSGDLGGYFHVTITDLDLATQYPLEFQYIYSDKRLNDNWSAVKYFTTVGATVPNEPQLQTTDVVGGAGFIKVAWSGNDAGGSPIANFDRVDVHISGTTFGDGTKAAGSFKSSGTQTFTCVAGVYIVQLKVYSLNGESSFFSTARTVTVTEVTEEIQTPVAPTGFSSSRILGGIEVAWAGTYGSAWTGFEAINIYAGTSSSATGGTYIKVGQMTANKISNKIVVPVDGTYVRYNVPVYIHASSVNKNGIESAISANVTSQSSGARSAIGTDLDDLIITNEKLVNDAVSAAKILTGAITTTKIADDAITSPKIIANAITADKITTGAIIADKIATNAITATKILAGTIDVSKLAAGTISVNNLEAGNINSTSYIRAGSGSTGGRIEISSSAVGSVSAGLYIYNSSGTPVLSAPLGGGLTIVGDGTFSGNLSAAGGTFTGTLSAATGSFSGTITASGGTIGGVIIASDAIQNGSTSGNSTFRLDSTGKARFGTSNGNALILNPSPSTGGHYIYHSSNGGTAASGKFSVSDGGILTATGATFSGTITNSTSSDYWNNDGTFRFGGSAGISFNGSAITMGSSVTLPAAQITGTLTADAIVANASISSPTITGGVFKTATSGQRIVINETANQIDIYPSSSMNPGGIYGTTYSSAGALRIDSPYISGYSQPSITLYSLGAGLAYIQVTANVSTFSGGATFGAGIDASAVGTSYFRKLDIGDTVYANNLGTGSGLAIHQVQSGGNAGFLKVNTSTQRHKENINYIESNGYLNKVTSMNPVFFTYKEEYGDPNRTELGLIAEDLENLGGFETVLHYNNDGEIMGISYDKLSSMLILALKEVKARLDALEA